jgi:hypothetical protein
LTPSCPDPFRDPFLVRNKKPPPEEVAQMVLNHSGGDFLEAPIKIKEV